MEGIDESVGKKAVEGLTRIFGEAAPGTLFSEPIHVGDDLVVNAVAWERAGGFGFGSGGGEGPQGEQGGGGGAGGGGASQGRPVAVIRIRAGGAVEVRPVIDFTKIGVTVLLGLIAAWKVIR